MGNTFPVGRPRNKKAKIMKIDGQIFKLKTPIQVYQVLQDYTGHVLLESKAVKRYGIRANPLDPLEFLDPRKIYFLVELPKPPVMVSRRCLSDGGGGGGGSVRVKVRLPKAEVDKLIGESRDEVEVAERIVDLYVKKKKKKKAGDGGGRRTVVG